MGMIETVKGIVMFTGCVLAKIIMEGLKVIIGLMAIGIIMFVIVLIKAIHDGVFRDEDDDDDIDYLDDLDDDDESGDDDR